MLYGSSIWGRTKPYLRRIDEDRTIAHDRKRPYRKWRQSCSLSGSMLCATGSCAIFAIVRTFDRKWQSHVTGSGPVRKRSRSEVCSTHAPFSPPRFFLISSTMIKGCDQRSLDTFGSPWVCACTTGSCATPVVTEGHVTPSEMSLGCSLGRPRPITI